MLAHCVYMTEDFTGNNLSLVAGFVSQNDAVAYAIALLKAVDKNVSDRACYIQSFYTYSNGNTLCLWRYVPRLLEMWNERINTSAMTDRAFRQQWTIVE